MNFVFPFAGDGVISGPVYFVDSIAEAKALPALRVGATVHVAGQDAPFIVVDDDTLSSDGGTVLIPDSELSEVYEETILESAFYPLAVSTPNVFMEYDLDHAGIDLESVEAVLTDDGQQLTGWDLHGHVLSPGTGEDREGIVPLIDCGRGKLRDPYAILTYNTNERTGGMLLRYRYATSGLRLKRATGPTWDLRWWSVIAVSEETGTQVDNGNYIRWALNSATAAGASELFFHGFYHFSDTIEQPDGVAFVGRGLELSGIRVMDGKGYWELLIANSLTPDIAAMPLATPVFRPNYYKYFFASYTPTVSAASGAQNIQWRHFKYDGNITNNNIWDNHTDYAYVYAQNNSYFHNAPYYVGFSWSNHAGRVVPTGARLILHEVEISGTGGGSLLGNQNSWCISTGRLRVGDCMHNHIMYLMDGQYERIEQFGFTWGEGLRTRNMHIGHYKDRPYRRPNSVYDNSTGAYTPTASEKRLSCVQQGPQASTTTFPGPDKQPHKLVIDYYDGDYTGMDDIDPGYDLTQVYPFQLAADTIQIKAAHLRAAKTLDLFLIYPIGNAASGPYKNVSVKLAVETGSRDGFNLFSSNPLAVTWGRADFDITVEPLAASHIPENPSPGGNTILLGNINCIQDYGDTLDGEEIDFSGITAADLAGDYIDLTPPDAGALPIRVWFDYNNTSSAPSGTGRTLIECNVAVGATAAAVAAAFSAAIRADSTATALITAATFNDKVVVGSYTLYRASPLNQVTVSVANATGVITTSREFRRHYEPSIIDFKVWAPDPVYICLLTTSAEIGADRDITFTFKDSALGAYQSSYPLINMAGGLNNANVDAAKDKVHFIFENTIFDLRDGSTWQNSDLMLYAGHFRNCRVRTPAVATGVTSLGTGYEELYSEQSGVETWTPSGAETTRDIQTKLFWIPKGFAVNIYPANAATAALWNTIYLTWRRKGGTALGGSGAYYQGPAAINEDRRAPVLRLNFTAAPAAVELAVGWSATVSP